MNETVLQVKDLHTSISTGRGELRAVDGISLSLQRGRTLALLGESGCGKSMAALSIMRLLPSAARVQSGQVLMHGQDLLGIPENRMRGVRGGRVSMIFQEPQSSLNPVLTVGAQIGESVVRHQPLRGKACRERVVELLDSVGIPDPARRAQEYPHQMSGGMKQRVMIAMALAGEPEVLIADEPTTALDVTIQAQVLDLLRDLQRQRGMAILLITHDLGVVSEMADEVAVMYAGHLVETAQRDSFFEHPQHPYTRKLFAAVPGQHKRRSELEIIPGTVPPLTTRFSGCRFANRCALAWDYCNDHEPGWFTASHDHQVRCHRYDEQLAVPEESPDTFAGADTAAAANISHAPADLLRVKELKVHFPIVGGVLRRVTGHVKAVDGLSFELQAGRTLALVGESGCGKTTAGKGLLRLLQPSAGSVWFDGDEITQLERRAMRRRRSDMQIVFQDPYASMNPRMRIGDIVSEGLQAQNLVKGRASRQQRAGELLEQVGLKAGMLDRFPHEFSGGQRQRICIARALAVEPRLLVCDEPTSALDVSVQAQILNLLQELQRKLGLAYLFITHNLSVVDYLAHDVAVMYLGRIVEKGPVDRVMNQPSHPYTQALLSAVPLMEADTGREVIHLEGDLPSPANPPRGCHFHPRCPRAMAQCRSSYPDRRTLADGREVSCWLVEG